MESSIVGASNWPGNGTLTIIVIIIVASFCIGSKHVVRIPIALLFGGVLFIEVSLYFLLCSIVVFLEWLLADVTTVRGACQKRRKLKQKLLKARNYRAWEEASKELDILEGFESWKSNEQHANCNDFHPSLLIAATSRIKEKRDANDIVALLELLRVCISWNFGGYMNAELYTKSHVGTKEAIVNFVHEVKESLICVKQKVENGALKQELPRCVDFVHDGSIAFGTTCLFLSGGAALGFYHFGVLRALLAGRLMPNLVCGTSMGSIVAAFIATRTNEEALEELNDLTDLYNHVGWEGGPMQGSAIARLTNVLRRGYAFDHAHMLRHLEWFTKGMTFAEAYERTGRIVSITCTPERSSGGSLGPQLLNRISAPNVTLSSAVMASSCVPGLIPAVKLQEKIDGELRPWGGMAWNTANSVKELMMRDGSFQSDVPIKTITSLFNTHFSIVSQVNPHIIPFFFHPCGDAGNPVRFPWREYRGGFLIYLAELCLKEDMIKNLTILQKTSLLFKVLGIDWSYLFTQQDHGEMTIVPSPPWWDYFTLLENVWSKRKLENMVLHSERNTWKNFTRLKLRADLQHALGQLREAVSNASNSIDRNSSERALSCNLGEGAPERARKVARLVP